MRQFDVGSSEMTFVGMPRGQDFTLMRNRSKRMKQLLLVTKKVYTVEAIGA
jgi:hypothetical protein